MPHIDVRPEIVAIVASTGGPAALSEIVKQLPGDFPLPVVIVQHITSDFLTSMVNWMRALTALRMVIAEAGTHPEPGTIYLAPGHAHLALTKNHRFALDTTTGGRHIPSGDVLFESVAESYGAAAIGVILTGMGSDGARGLCKMCDAGAFTIAQDEVTSAVYGMPREAVVLGAVKRVLPLSEISNVLIQLTRNKDEKL